MGNSIREKLKKDILLLDGAFGTYAQLLGLKDEYFEGKPGCMEYLSIVYPDFVRGIHEDYLEAGSDAVETNTFGGSGLKLEEYQLGDMVYDINFQATKLARTACDEFSTPTQPRYVIGTMGPTGKLPSSTDPELGDVTYVELVKMFYEQALGIIDGGGDAILVETGQDLLEMKAAVIGAKRALKEKRKDLFLMAQCTLANSGRMLLGTEVAAAMSTLAYLGVDAIGLNCSTGPVEMENQIAFLSENCPVLTSCVPNAGLPIEVKGETVYPLEPEDMARIMSGYMKKYKIDIVGGCCGTNPEHISLLRKELPKVNKRKTVPNKYFASFYSVCDISTAKRPLKVGERINTQGSRKMKDLLLENNYDGIIELGKSQQKAGADILDVCSVLTERPTEERDAVILTKRICESVQIPLMIDSTDDDVIEAALQNYPGTAFINSVNFEDGGKRAHRVFALAKEHGSFIVSLVIDEKGMAKTVENKLEIAERLYKMAVEEYGIEPHRMVFDMLTFTLGTGDDEFVDAAVKTCESIKELKKKFPEVLTILGVSNISFGLAREGRKVLNMVFLHHAVEAGLDLAIINPSEYVEYKDIPKDEREICDDLVFARKPDALNNFVDFYAAKKPAKDIKKTEEEEPATIEEKIRKCIMDRDKVSIIPLVQEAKKTTPAEDIINGTLMDTMKEVGEMLDSGEMVLPYVLQCAEVMRKAIEYLEDYLPGDVSIVRGKVLLATVFGDVHDIGKNLVKMILKNNGFEVIDLGKQVPIDKIVEEAVKNKVDAVGLSALLVSTARHMKTCVQTMHDAGLEYPLLIGGAPINKGFSKQVAALNDKSIYKGGVFYAKDAFTGLKIMQILMDPEQREAAMKEYVEVASKEDEEVVIKTNTTRVKAKSMGRSEDIPVAPFYGIRHLTNISADDVFACLSERFLFDVSWGTRLKDKEQKQSIIEEEYKPLLKDLKQESIREGWLDLKAVYGYFQCRIKNTVMEVLDGSGEVLETFEFERMKGGTGVCLADYFVSKEGELDLVAFQVVTIGDKMNKAIEKFHERQEVTNAFFLHGLSVNLAEAVAEYVHGIIKRELNLGNDQGKRYSPGYPLWKNLEDQEKLFRLLDVERRIGVQLSEGFQMIPEQSTSAIVVYNSKAEY